VAKPLRGVANCAGARFRLERMRQMRAQVEPGDRYRDDDSENHSARETDGRQPAIERDMRAERQAICPENFEQSNSHAPTARPSNPPTKVRRTVR